MLGEDHASNVTNSNVGPVRWMPPEALIARSYSKASDVYAFGVVLFELVSGGERPWKDQTLPGVAAAVLQGKTLEPYLPRATPEALRKLMIKCWSRLPADRPTMTHIVTELRSYVKHLLLVKHRRFCH